MDLKPISDAVHKFGGLLHKNSPTILTGMAVAGTVTSTVMAIQVTPRAKALLDGIEEANGEVTWKDYAIIVKDFYIPTILSEAATIACIIASNRISAKRTAAIAAAHSIMETTLSKYQNQIMEDFGEHAANKIAEKVDASYILENPVDESMVIETSKGGSLCYDPLSGRYFRTDISELKSAQNELNYRLINETFIPLNDLYEILGLDILHEVVGDELGWSISRGQVEFRLTAQIASNGEPCIVLGYDIYPEYNYRSLYPVY